MIDPKTWKPAAMAALKAAFGERLLCLGLQGSYLRGEATADSDIDLLVVLDQVTIDDLDAFHAAMRSLPDGERAVGFTCGRCFAMPCRATPSCPSARPTSATMTSWARRSTRFSKHGAPAR